VDVLNQAEIDQLISSLASGSPGVEASGGEKAVKVYDFRRPNKFNKDQLRAVHMLHDSFARHLTNILSTMTRSMVSAEVANVEQLPYEEFVNSVLAPTTLAILEVRPFGGKALMEIKQTLVFALIDRMLGGKGLPLEEPRECTDLERVIVDRVLDRIIGELDESWKTIKEDISFHLFGEESNPFFVQIVPKNEMVLLVTLRVQVGQIEGQLNLCLPFHCIEPVIDKFNPQEWFIARDNQYSAEGRQRLKKRIRDVKVDLTAELCDTTLTLKELAEIAEGDVINLGKPITEPGLLKVGPIPKFNVVFGNVEDRMCAKIVEILPPQENE
jgi:flagellar motor switch protein FliM